MNSSLTDYLRPNSIPKPWFAALTMARPNVSSRDRCFSSLSFSPGSPVPYIAPKLTSPGVSETTANAASGVITPSGRAGCCGGDLKSGVKP